MAYRVRKDEGAVLIDCNGLFIGLSWEYKEKSGGIFDVYSSALIDGEGDEILYFSNRRLFDDSIVYYGDNLLCWDSEPEDDEIIGVNLDKIPKGVKSIYMALSIFGSREKALGDTEDIRLRIYDSEASDTVCEYKSDSDLTGKRNLILGKLFREGEKWYLKPVDEGFDTDGVFELKNCYKSY